MGVDGIRRYDASGYLLELPAAQGDGERLSGGRMGVAEGDVDGPFGVSGSGRADGGDGLAVLLIVAGLQGDGEQGGVLMDFVEVHDVVGRRLD